MGGNGGGGECGIFGVNKRGRWGGTKKGGEKREDRNRKYSLWFRVIDYTIDILKPKSCCKTK